MLRGRFILSKVTHDYSKHVLAAQLNTFVVRVNQELYSLLGEPYASISSKREHPPQAIPWVLQRIPSRPAGICTICTNLNCRVFAQSSIPYLNCINKPV